MKKSIDWHLVSGLMVSVGITSLVVLIAYSQQPNLEVTTTKSPAIKYEINKIYCIENTQRKIVLMGIRNSSYLRQMITLFDSTGKAKTCKGAE